jgi:hypothetical protein
MLSHDGWVIKKWKALPPWARHTRWPSSPPRLRIALTTIADTPETERVRVALEEMVVPDDDAEEAEGKAT